MSANSNDTEWKVSGGISSPIFSLWAIDLKETNSSEKVLNEKDVI